MHHGDVYYLKGQSYRLRGKRIADVKAACQGTMSA